MDLLLYFALPVATIILAIVFQKIIKCPILVAATAFAIFLIVTYAAFDSAFLIFAIIYTILAYLAASVVSFICKYIGRNGFFRNINAENINTNTLSANSVEINDDTDDDSESCCSCGRNNRKNNSYRNCRNLNGYYR